MVRTFISLERKLRMFSDSGTYRHIRNTKPGKFKNVPLYGLWLILVALFFGFIQFSLFETIDIPFSDILFTLVEEQFTADSFEESPIVLITIGNQSIADQKNKNFRMLHRENFVELVKILKYTRINVFDYFFTKPADELSTKDIQDWMETFEGQISKGDLERFLAENTQDFKLAKIALENKNCVFPSIYESDYTYFSTDLVFDYLVPKVAQIFRQKAQELNYDLEAPLEWAPEEEHFHRFLDYLHQAFSAPWEDFYQELQQQPNFQEWLRWLNLHDAENTKVFIHTLKRHWEYLQKVNLESGFSPKSAEMAFNLQELVKILLENIGAESMIQSYHSLTEPKPPFYEYSNNLLREFFENPYARTSDLFALDLQLRLLFYQEKLARSHESWNSVFIVRPDLPILPLVESSLPSIAVTKREKDGVHRNYPVVQRVWIRDQFYLCSNLALSAYLQMHQLDTYALKKEPDAVFIPALEMSIPINKDGYTRILWKGAWGADFPQIELSEVLQGYNNATDKEAYQKKWAGKICFIGESTVGSTDRGTTPLDKYYPMVGAHAHFMRQLLERRFIRDASTRENALFFSWIILLAIFSLSFESWRINLIGIASLLGILPLLFVGIYIFFGIIYAITYPMFGVIFLALITFFYRYITIGRSQRAIRYMFATMVSPEILSYMEKNPDAFSLKGESKDVSVMFSDVAGFTSMSEKMDPSTLVTLLNFYLTAMTDVILGHHGYIDKYEGDAIMAVWGVPISSETHAVDCCYAALDQLEKLKTMQETLKQRFGVDLHIRIGINSGIVSAGCMGSENKKMSYTIMGDVVNLGSRLESANKNYKTPILIGKNTYEKAKDKIVARPIDRLIVVGKTEPVTVFHLIAKKGQLSSAEEEKYDLFRHSLELYWKQEWDQAEQGFHEYLTHFPGDSPAEIYLERIHFYRKNPPDADWKGEFRLVFK